LKMTVHAVQLFTSKSVMPSLGLGTWLSLPGEVGNAVKLALEAGYRHFDCAKIYKNEVEIGEALKHAFDKGLVKREQVFVTSKLWNTDHERVRAACEQTLRDLKLKYLDLYLIHWPISQPNDVWDTDAIFDADGKLKLNTNVTLPQVWKEMEKLVDAGLVKNIGLSNWNVARMKELLPQCRIKPAVLQVELHPYLPQDELLKFCQQHQIAVTAYSPLGTNREPKLLEDQVIVDIAKKHGKTPAQICLAWAIARNTITIPKSVNPKRIVENSQLFDWKLDEEDMNRIKNIGKHVRYISPAKFWKYPLFEDEVKQ